MFFIIFTLKIPTLFTYSINRKNILKKNQALIFWLPSNRKQDPYFLASFAWAMDVYNVAHKLDVRVRYVMSYSFESMT